MDMLYSMGLIPVTTINYRMPPRDQYRVVTRLSLSQKPSPGLEGRSWAGIQVFFNLIHSRALVSLSRL